MVKKLEQFAPWVFHVKSVAVGVIIFVVFVFAIFRCVTTPIGRIIIICAGGERNCDLVKSRTELECMKAGAFPHIFHGIDTV